MHKVFDVAGTTLENVSLIERVLETPWYKDYDSNYGEGPLFWGENWSLKNWKILIAYKGDETCGGCVLAFDTDGVNMLEGRKDLAVLWDIRVQPHCRRSGIGKLLFDEAVKLAESKGCLELKVETQNINYSACRFYESQGCQLSEFNRGAYKDYPDEVQLIWRKQL
ncbi:GNAT family N-acetyltransferase [Lentisphaerota bacterium ZTH]|nr:GNAT family N-acetyltransferase [Lentisphaerota bacterium]WET05549.1 GNAT family N-acetyltransferase [Lentisphaerota bacterium ZTH]